MNELQTISITNGIDCVKGMDLPTLQNTYAELPSIETKEGYKFIADGLKEVKGYHKAVEDLRTERKRGILDDGLALDGEAKRVKGILKPIIDSMAEVKKEFDSRKKREKEAFEAKMQGMIDDITNIVSRGIDQSSGFIGELISEVGETDTEHGFYHRSGDAGIERTKALNSLTDMMGKAIESEQAQERLRELEAAEAERLANQVNDDHETGLMMNKLFDIDRAAEQKALAEQERLDAIEEEKRLAQVEKDRVENEKRIADEAVKQAKIDAERIAKETKERERVTEENRIAAEKQAKLDSEKAVKFAADQARIEAERVAKEAETKRLADEEKVRAADAKKAANKTHQTKILKAAKKALIEFGLEEVFAKKLALAIAKGEITNVKMEF